MPRSGLVRNPRRVFDYPSEGVAERVKEITGGRGVDLTLNPSAGESLKADLEALAPFGTAIVFGFLAGPPAGTFADDLARHFQKSVSARWSRHFGPPDARPPPPHASSSE